MHQSIPPAPNPPPPPPPPAGYCAAFAFLVSPGGGTFANFALRVPTLADLPSKAKKMLMLGVSLGAGGID